jgi:hypothetical protein
MTNVRKILIVDDDAAVRDFLVEHLALHDGIEAIAVESGAKGMRLRRISSLHTALSVTAKYLRCNRCLRLASPDSSESCDYRSERVDLAAGRAPLYAAAVRWPVGRRRDRQLSERQPAGQIRALSSKARSRNQVTSLRGAYRHQSVRLPPAGVSSAIDRMASRVQRGGGAPPAIGPDG